jgi:hypothetical protein
MRILVLVVLLILFTLVGCSIFNFTDQNDDFSYYINEFIIASKGKVVHSDFDNMTIIIIDMSKTYHKLNENIIGVCYPLFKHIVFDKTFWYNSSEIEKKALFFHEAGHCVLWYLLHNNEMLPDLCPASIMSSTLPDKFCLMVHWDDYIKELFKY